MKLSYGALLFGLDDAPAASVAARLGTALAPHEERPFEDGEHKARPLVSVRGRDVYVIASLYGRPGFSANDALCRLLFFCGAVGDAGAARVTAVAPYLCYSRKDRRTKPRDPVTTRYVAALFEAVGIDRVVTVDVHNLAAYENAFRIEKVNLSAAPLFVANLAPRLDGDVVVLSPDVGGVKRAEAFRDLLAEALGRPLPTAFMDKQRSEGVVSGDTIVGDVAGRTVVILDDLIASGTTIGRAARRCRDQGATRVIAAATHGVFVRSASEVVADPALDEVVVTDAIPPFRLDERARRKVTVVEVAPLLAEAIARLGKSSLA